MVHYAIGLDSPGRVPTVGEGVAGQRAGQVREDERESSVVTLQVCRYSRAQKPAGGGHLRVC